MANMDHLSVCSSCQSVCMEFGILLRPVRLMSINLILSCVISIQGRKPYLCDFVDKHAHELWLVFR